MTRSRQGGLGVMGLGLFLALGFGVPLGAHWLRQFGPGRVTACSVYWSHGTRAEVTLESGEKAHLSGADARSLERCFDVGATMEKPRWHLEYLVDGKPVEPRNPTHAICQMGVFIGAVLVGVGLERRRREERLSG